MVFVSYPTLERPNGKVAQADADRQGITQSPLAAVTESSLHAARNYAVDQPDAKAVLNADLSHSGGTTELTFDLAADLSRDRCRRTASLRVIGHACSSVASIKVGMA